MISIILVEPQMGENIGAAARAMKNFGVNDLRIVNPRDGWPNEQALAMSVGAADIINDAKIYNSLDSAIADLNMVYATSCQKRDMNKKVINSIELKNHIINSTSIIKQNIGIIFGRESSGLSNEELTRADTIVSITTTDFSSLNLGQAICIICYELFRHDANNAGITDQSDDYQINEIATKQNVSPLATKQNVSPLATKQDKQHFYNQLFNELQIKGFFKTEAKSKSMQIKIRNILERIDNLSTQELQTLRGIVSTLTKSSER